FFDTLESAANATPPAAAPKPPNRAAALLSVIDQTIEDYRLKKTADTASTLRTIRATSDCLDASLKGLASAITADMARDDDHFSVAGDVPMTLVLREIQHRSTIIANHQKDVPLCGG